MFPFFSHPPIPSEKSLTNMPIKNLSIAEIDKTIAIYKSSLQQRREKLLAKFESPEDLKNYIFTLRCGLTLACTRLLAKKKRPAGKKSHTASLVICADDPDRLGFDATVLTQLCIDDVPYWFVVDEDLPQAALREQGLVNEVVPGTPEAEQTKWSGKNSIDEMFMLLDMAQEPDADDEEVEKEKEKEAEKEKEKTQ